MKVPVVFSSFPSTASGRRTLEPFTTGVPLPAGVMTAHPSNWVLRAPDGTTSPVDAHVIDRWPDGTARWVVVDGQFTGATGSSTTTWTIEDAGRATVPQKTAIDVADTNGAVRVDTGAVTLTWGLGSQFPLGDVLVGGESILVPARSGLTLTDAAGTTSQARVERVSVEHKGALRACVRVEGSVSAGDGRRLMVEARVECYAGSPTIRVRTTVRNPTRAKHPGNFWDLGDPGSLLFKDVSIATTLRGDGAGTAFASVAAGEDWSERALPFEVYQDSSGGECWNGTNHINRDRKVPTSFRGYRVRAGAVESTGLRATPVVGISCGTRGVAATIPAFWQAFPKAIEARDSSLIVRILPGQFGDLHELQGGEQTTCEVFFSFGNDQVSDVPLDWCRHRTLAFASSEWVLSSGAVPFLAPLDAGHRELVDQAIDGPDRFEAKREVIDQYGWRHFGEIYGDHEAIGYKGPQPLVSHYNNQYDPVLGFALQFLRTGDRRWWSAMDELATHVIDIDIYHTTEDKWAYNGGLFWHTYHYGDADTCTHRTYPKKNTGTVHGGGPSADHNYPSGLALRYFMTGDLASKDAAVGLAEYVLRLDDWRLSPFRFLSQRDTGRTIFTPPDFYGPARSSGNSLNALVDGHRLTGDAKFLVKADQLVRRVVHPKDDFRKARLDEPEFRWFYAMFLQALGKYLHHKASIGQRDAAYAHGRASLLAYARWMADHEYPYLQKPEKLEYPTETWAAQDIRKADIFSHAAMHASGAERARFDERAVFFHRTSIATLLASPTRALARPVIVLLTSGIVQPWFVQHRDASLPAATVEVDLGEPERFVDQRSEAERRAKLIVATSAIVVVAALLVLLIWWVRR